MNNRSFSSWRRTFSNEASVRSPAGPTAACSGFARASADREKVQDGAALALSSRSGRYVPGPGPGGASLDFCAGVCHAVAGASASLPGGRSGRRNWPGPGGATGGMRCRARWTRSSSSQSCCGTGSSRICSAPSAWSFEAISSENWFRRRRSRHDRAAARPSAAGVGGSGRRDRATRPRPRSTARSAGRRRCTYLRDRPVRRAREPRAPARRTRATR
ncbi:hypothetical protein M885DRAFT_534633 [Pelagophyceae sp. CCMP2097]|nr:hypothetical protein M885DRAFT_534633 [Pelagophyceae sp. CCMP2097]